MNRHAPVNKPSSYRRSAYTLQNCECSVHVMGEWFCPDTDRERNHILMVQAGQNHNGNDIYRVHYFKIINNGNTYIFCSAVSPAVERAQHAYLIIIIIMYIYHALINALSAHMIHINLNMIFYTHVEHSPTKTIYIKFYIKK